MASIVHLHNGDVVAQLAIRAGIPGEHLAFREVLSAGPVTPGDDFLATRARFIAEHYGTDVLRASNDLFQQEERFSALATDDSEIVLWFEHDLFCLANFLYLLQRFPGKPLSYVWHSTPLGQLEEHELYELYTTRMPVTPPMLSDALGAWRDYTAHDPRALNDWLERGHSDFPFLRDGLTLHAMRFPSTKNGLGIVETRALYLIGAGISDLASLFPRLDSEPPRLGFGDTEVLRHLRSLANRAVPLITLSEAPPKAIFSLTEAGENVLRGDVDDTRINDPDVWLGGAHVTKETMWRWDDKQRRIVVSLSLVS
ncbi:MAG TPA: hypothetical protein VF618_13275 [Thermoanaerobaculia bacterium]